MKNQFVKKLSAVSSAAVMAAALLAGCGSSSQTAASTAPAAASTEAAAQTASTEAAAQTASTGAAADTASSTAAAASSTAAVSGEVTAAGSSALLPLAQAAAESFMKENPDCVITVNGGGSGEGLKQVADGSVDIGDSDVFAEEKLGIMRSARSRWHRLSMQALTSTVSRRIS